MERIGHLITISINDNLWKLIVLSSRGPLISHLFFADDLILFGETSLNQVDVFKQCLDMFCSSNINFNNVAKHLNDNLGISLSSDLGKYLGVPLHHKKENKETYQYILDKINKTLSLAHILASIYDSIDKTCNNVIWGEKEENK